MFGSEHEYSLLRELFLFLVHKSNKNIPVICCRNKAIFKKSLRTLKNNLSCYAVLLSKKTLLNDGIKNSFIQSAFMNEKFFLYKRSHLGSGDSPVRMKFFPFAIYLFFVFFSFFVCFFAFFFCFFFLFLFLSFFLFFPLLFLFF